VAVPFLNAGYQNPGSFSQVRSLVRCLEEVVLPSNKFTRGKGDVRGSALHMPGLIKAVATDFAHKKVMM
jgi:hypothetical protein